jgi:hypothetical protein
VTYLVDGVRSFADVAFRGGGTSGPHPSLALEGAIEISKLLDMIVV